MANQINNFFADIGPNLARNIPESLIQMDYSFDNSRPVFELVHTNVDEVAKLIKGILNKSTGLDDIPIKFLKLNLDLSARIISHTGVS